MPDSPFIEAFISRLRASRPRRAPQPFRFEGRAPFSQGVDVELKGLQEREVFEPVAFPEFPMPRTSTMTIQGRGVEFLQDRLTARFAPPIGPFRIEGGIPFSEGVFAEIQGFKEREEQAV